MATGLRFTSDKFQKQLDELVSRGRDLRAYFKAIVQPQFFKAQATRWQTENMSEGFHWEGLNPSYREWKIKRYAAFPGGGRKLMVAKSKLFNSVVGRDKSGLSILTEKTRITFAVNLSVVPYAKYAAEKRPFMKFGRETREQIVKGLADYYYRGVVPRGGQL